MGRVSSSVFKSGENRKRIRPGGEGWARAVFLAYATAAAEACDLGADLAQRAGRLTGVAPKLRAKGSADVIKLLLSDDAVPGSWSSPKLSARGARRLFDRLSELGAVRELSITPFTDIVMPGGLNGADLVKKAMEIRPGVRLLFTSGYMENALTHHVSLDPELLSKPYSRTTGDHAATGHFRIPTFFTTLGMMASL